MTTALLSGLVAVPALAQDATWNGSVTDSYENPLNWTTGVLPGADGIATFNGVADGGSDTVNLAGSRTINGLVVSDIGTIGGGTFVFENDLSAAQLIYSDLDAGALADDLTLDAAGQTLSIVANTDMDFGGNIVNQDPSAATIDLVSNEGARIGLSGSIRSGTGGTLGLSVTGGAVSLSGTNTFDGGTVVSAGLLEVSGGRALSDLGAVTVNGELALVGSDETVGTLSGGATGLVTLNDRTLTIAGSDATQFDGTLQGGGALALDNGAQLVLGGDNSGYDGRLSVADDSTLSGGANAFGTGTISLGTDGVVAVTENTTLSNEIIASGGGGAIVAQNGSRVTLTGNIRQNGSLTFGDSINSGVFVLETTEVTGRGSAVIAVNTEVVLSSDPSADLLLNGLELNGILNLNGVDANLDGVTGSGMIRSGADAPSTITLTGDDSFTGGFADSAGGALSLDIDPGFGGQVVLNGAGSTYTGDTTIRTGTLAVSDGDAVSDNSTVVVNAGTNFEVQSNETVGSLAGIGRVDLQASTLTLGNAADGRFSGQITGSGGLAFDFGAGNRFALESIANSYRGDTTIRSGTLVVEGGNAIGDRSTVEVEAAGRFELNTTETVRALNNNGTVSLVGGNLTADSVSNAGQLEVSGTSVIDGDLINTTAGTIAMAGNGTSGDRLEISGDATLNGTVSIDLELNSSTATVDSISVAGRLGGDVTLAFNDLSASPGTFEGGVAVVDYGTIDPEFTFSHANLPTGGPVIYNLAMDETTDSLTLRSSPNPAIAGISSGLTLTQSLINTVVNRPTSPFVAGLAAEDENPCGFGTWARGTGGRADATGETGTSVGSFASQIEARYAGLQIGFDYSCFDSRFAGFDLSFGAIAGVNTGSLSQPVFQFDPSTLSINQNVQSSVNETDFDQTYGGVYLGASRGRLFADMQLRFDKTSFDLVNTALISSATGGGVDDLGVADQEYDSNSTTISGSVGYAFPLREDGGLVFVPAVGVALSRTSVDDLRFDGGTPDNIEDDGLLQIDNIDGRVGFLSATLSSSKVLPSGTAALNYFGTVTYYEDFGSDTTSRFFAVDADGLPVGDPLTTTSGTLGAYTELSLGLNYTKLIEPGRAGGARQFDASVRLDGRFSGGLDGYGITAQMRYQF